MTPDGYCGGGLHYIGDADECWQCQLWEQQKAKGRTYRAVTTATRLDGAVGEWRD